MISAPAFPPRRLGRLSLASGLLLNLLCLVLWLSPQAALEAAGPATEADANRDWQAILALDSGPREAASNRNEARAVALAFLARQEEALRAFIQRHPDDRRGVDARLRLAHLLAMKGDFAGDSSLYAAATRLLEQMQGNVPEPRRADVAFALLSLSMRGITVATDAEREAITMRMKTFRQQYPNDRRIAGLIAEVATLYDAFPKRKEAMLQEALVAARTEEVRARILDDLKRLSFLGKPVELKGRTPEGVETGLAEHRGKVALVYFFASWSPPSVAALEEVHYLRRTFRESEVAILGVSLDPTREALASLKITSWPVLWDGEGWRSPIIRQFGINALPTLWILDKTGRLRTLNAKTESEALVRALLKEK